VAESERNWWPVRSVITGRFGAESVAESVKQAVAYGFKHRDWGEVLYIGIDELSRRKGQVYVTNVYDLSTKSLLWSGEGRTQETLRKFLQRAR
jgi:transposase